MKLAIICFTESGYNQMKLIEEKLPSSDPDLQIICMHHKCRVLRSTLSEGKTSYYEASVEDWAREAFERRCALLFIGATGIAVRAIAPFVKDKLSDSPVLVMDDLGKFIIPILSGHVGGANALAHQISRLTGALPVITTATDIHEKFAIDVWAKENHLTIKNKEAIATVSAKVLRGEKLTEDDVCISLVPPRGQTPWGQTPGGQTLWLQPKEYILGIGCKKGKSEEEIRKQIEKALSFLSIDMDQLYAITSIDVKKEEPGIIAVSEKEQIPFWTFTPEELNQVEGFFHESQFVKQQVGVGCVCERAAVLGAMQIVNSNTQHGCKAEALLVLPKQAQDGVTIAIAKCPFTKKDDSIFIPVSV